MSTPLVLADNLFETTVLHPAFVLTSPTPEVGGAEVFRVADNLRDVTRYVGQGPQVDCGAPAAASCVVLDRGHSLAGHTVFVQACPDPSWAPGAYYNVATPTIPTTPGGVPSGPGGCLTPEGVWWATFPATAARCWRVIVNGPDAPQIFTGVYLGQAYQFPEYWDGPSSLDYRLNVKVLKNAVSDAGVRIKRHLRAFAELQLRATLEEEDYAAFNPLVWRLLAQGQPWWVCVDLDANAAAPGTGASPIRLFQAPEGGVYDPTGTVNRAVDLLLEEVAPRIAL